MILHCGEQGLGLGLSSTEVRRIELPEELQAAIGVGQFCGAFRMLYQRLGQRRICRRDRQRPPRIDPGNGMKTCLIQEV